MESHYRKPRSTPAGSSRLASLQAQMRRLREELEAERQTHKEILDSQRELELSREQYANLYDFAPVGYLTMDGRGIIHEVNLTAARMFGESRAAILGRPLRVFVSKADQQTVLSHFAALRRGEPPIAIELTLGGRHATPRTIELSMVRAALDTVAAPIRRYHAVLIDISERRKAEELAHLRLAEIEDLYRNAPVGLCMLDRGLRFIRINDRLGEINGIPAAEHIGRTIRELMPQLADATESGMRQVLETGRPKLNIEIEGETPAAPGIQRSWIEQWLPTMDAQGRVTGLNIVVEETTERKKVEEALRHSEARFRALAEALPLIVWSAEAAGEIDYCNPWGYAYGGVGPEDAHQWKWTDLIHPNDLDPTHAIWRTALVSGRPFQSELRLRRADGEFRWHQNQGVPLRNKEGQVTRWIGTAIDIHDQKTVAEILEQRVGERTADLSRAEKELRRAGAYNRTLIETSPDPLVTIGPDGKITDVNRATEQFTGRARNELIGTDFSDYFTEPERAQAGYREVFAKGSVHDYALDLRHRDGRIFHVLYNASVYRDETEKVVGVFAAARDVTLRREAEKELRRAGAYNRTLIETSPDPLVTIGPDGKITDVNRATEQFTGRARNELIGTDFSDYFTEPEQAQAGYREVFAKGNVHDYALDLRHRDGRIFHVLYNASVYRDETGKVAGVFAAARDVTLRQEAEAELQRAHNELEARAAQLRALAAELTLTEQRERKRLALVLHDGLQQTLVAAKFRLALLERSKNAAQASADVSNLIDDCIETSRSLTAELSPPILHQGGLIAALEWLVQWMRDKHGLSVELISQGQHEMLPEEIRILLFQSVRELLFNVAKHAGTRKARIGITQMDGHIQVEVTDEGIGFDPGQIGGSANPEGSGMGLFSIRERLGYLGGTMKIDAAPGKGAQFTLIAPLARGPEALREFSVESRTSVAFAPRSASSKDDAAKIQVVLVDDHPLMRQGLASLLRAEQDISVIGEASDGKAAIDLVRSTRPAVVLMDISMPGMDGVEATRRIHEQMPEVKIIGLSMFQADEQGAAIIAAGAVKYLPKTGPAEAVIETIRNCTRAADSTIVS